MWSGCFGKPRDNHFVTNFYPSRLQKWPRNQNKLIEIHEWNPQKTTFSTYWIYRITIYLLELERMYFCHRKHWYIPNPFLNICPPPSPPSWVMQIQTIRSTDCRMNGNFANWQLCFLHLDFLTFFVTLAHSDLIWVSQASNEWGVSGRKDGESGRVLPARDVDAGKIRQILPILPYWTRWSLVQTKMWIYPLQ